MRFRALAGLVLLLGPLSPGLPAQEAGSRAFGVMGALTFSRFGGLDRDGYDRSRVWLTGGLFARFPLSPGLSLQPELLLAQKGAKHEEPGFASGVTITYVEVPVLLRLALPLRRPGLAITPHLYGGGAFGFKVRCRISFISGVASSTQSCADGGFPIKSTDLASMVGAGVDLGPATVGARYELGLLNIGGDASNRDLKNRTFLLLIGWTFRSPR